MGGKTGLWVGVCVLWAAVVLGGAEREDGGDMRGGMVQRGRSLTQSGVDLFGDKIIDGERTTIDKYPFLASLRAGEGLFSGNVSLEGIHLCGGSLVAKNIVLTAAHCVNDALFRRPTVYFNITEVNSPDFLAFNVLETRVHPRYQEFADGSSNYDAALLVLDGEPDVPWVQIRYDDRCFQEGADCTVGDVAGWGLTREADPSSAAPSLLHAEIPLIPQKICRRIYGNRVTDAMVCAGGGTRDACQGDSGGPLLINDKLAGVVSWGFGCGRPGLPGLYTNLAFLKPWLQQQFQDILGRQPGHNGRETECHYRSGVYLGAGCRFRGGRR